MNRSRATSGPRSPLARYRAKLAAERAAQANSGEVSRFCGEGKPGRCKKGETGVGDRKKPAAGRKKADKPAADKKSGRVAAAQAKAMRIGKRTAKALFKGGTAAKVEAINAWKDFRKNMQTNSFLADQLTNAAMDGAQGIGKMLYTAVSGWRKTARTVSKNYRQGSKTKGGLASVTAGAGRVLIGVAHSVARGFTKNYKKDIKNGYSPRQAMILGAVQGISTMATNAAMFFPGTPNIGWMAGAGLSAIGNAIGVGSTTTGVPFLSGLPKALLGGIFKGTNAIHKSMKKTFAATAKHAEKFAERRSLSALQIVKIIKKRMLAVFRQAAHRAKIPADSITIPDSLIAKTLTALTQGKSPFQMA